MFKFLLIFVDAGRLILTIVFFYDIILKNIIICKDMEV